MSQTHAGYIIVWNCLLPSIYELRQTLSLPSKAAKLCVFAMKRNLYFNINESLTLTTHNWQK